MKYFKREEFACKCGCGFSAVDYELLTVLTDIREHFDSPVVITSACRCIEYNKSIGGTEHSYHTKGLAADIKVSGVSPERVHHYATEKYPNSKGIGSYELFTHIDVRDVKASEQTAVLEVLNVNDNLGFRTCRLYV